MGRWDGGKESSPAPPLRVRPGRLSPRDGAGEDFLFLRRGTRAGLQIPSDSEAQTSESVRRGGRGARG